jgi:hypothetical protein
LEVVQPSERVIKTREKILRVLRRCTDNYKLTVDDVIGVMSMVTGELLSASPQEFKAVLRQAAITNFDLAEDARNPPKGSPPGSN